MERSRMSKPGTWSLLAVVPCILDKNRFSTPRATFQGGIYRAGWFHLCIIHGCYPVLISIYQRCRYSEVTLHNVLASLYSSCSTPSSALTYIRANSVEDIAAQPSCSNCAALFVHITVSQQTTPPTHRKHSTKHITLLLHIPYTPKKMV